ncbi:hypothetical protein COCON_G00109080 [Conger conger]|uniref:Uncharacterized protein n=1 Tax=Conger conger TaxID=82655 RepID=A0A9Q1DJC6_CONCO|nr:hypothetical protein COCON_G00109080 [Conger conger]
MLFKIDTLRRQLRLDSLKRLHHDDVSQITDECTGTQEKHGLVTPIKLCQKAFLTFHQL